MSQRQVAQRERTHRESAPLNAEQIVTQDPLLTTKLTTPRLRAPLVLRPALLARLDAGLDHKLTLVSAPAGFGKTTLVSQWIAHCHEDAGCKRAWVALDAGDNDPVRFWRYVFSACQQFDAQVGVRSLALLNAQQPAFEAALTILINEMAQLRGRHILVMEDYHFIAAPAVHEMLLFLLDHLPDTLHVMLLTRHDPPLPLARLRARRELHEIGAAELRFSPEETAQLLQQTLPAPLAPEMIARLDARTEGWVAALRLVVLALHGKRGSVEIEQFLADFGGGHGHIVEYLVEEVLAAQPATIQDFLLQTSFLNRLTASLCNAVTGRDDSALLLEQMERANLFLVALDGAQQWYRYHGLFAEGMNHYARRHFAKAQINAIYTRASQWYEEHDLLGEAYESAIALRDYPRGAALLEQIIAPQIVRNQFHTLRRWFEALPEEVLHTHPHLCLKFAISILFTSERQTPATHQQIAPLLRVAEAAWRASDNRPQLGELLAFRSLVSWFQPNIPQSIAEAREALDLLPLENVQWRGIATIFVGLDELLQGRMEVGRQALRQGLTFNHQAQNIYAILDTLLLLGRIAIEQGDLRQAAHTFAQVFAELEQYPMTPSQAEIRKSRAYAGLGTIALLRNELEAAESYATRASEHAQATFGEDLRVEATLLVAKVQHALGQRSAAHDTIQTLLAQSSQPHTRHEIQCVQMQLALINEDWVVMQGWSPTPPMVPLPQLHRETETLLLARLYLVQSQPQDALALLDAAQSNASTNGRFRNLITMHILTALATHDMDDAARAKDALRASLVLAQKDNHQRVFLDAGERMADLVRGLLRELKEESLLDFARALLLAFAQAKATAKSTSQPTGQVPESTIPTVDSALLLEPLSAQERRVLRLLAANRSNPEIADELVVSLNTVKTHVKNIFSKLDVHSRAEASDLARQLHLL